MHLGFLVDCRIEFVSAQAAAGVRVFPLDRASVGGVGVDVTTEFASQVRAEVKMPRAMTSRSILANQISNWLSHEEYVGVK